MRLDKFLIHHSDAVWDISERINFGRFELNHYYVKYNEQKLYIGVDGRKFMGEEKYQKIHNKIIPLSYPPSYFRYTEKCDKSLLVFVGLDPYGLEYIPPEVKFEWIGRGKTPLYELLNKLALSGIGISLWDKQGNNFYGDPGKTKLYSACGLPVIMTGNTPYAEIIKETQAGIVIDWFEGLNTETVLSSCKKIWKNYSFYKRNVKKTWEHINADKVFENIRLLD
jgi:hypothetical protein